MIKELLFITQECDSWAKIYKITRKKEEEKKLRCPSNSAKKWLFFNPIKNQILDLKGANKEIFIFQNLPTDHE